MHPLPSPASARLRRPRRSARWLIPVLLAGLALLPAGCGPTVGPLDLTIHFTGDTRGRLVPCGCFTGQHGGLTRLRTVLATPRGPGELRVDVGDAIEGTEDYQVMKYAHLLSAYRLMDFDALNVGRREAALSAAELRGAAQRSGAPLISANVVDRTSRQPLLPGFRIVERGSRKIGIIGVVDPAGVPQPGDGVLVEPMEATLARLLPEVRSQVDLIVLLAFTDEPTLARLAREFYELDVILGGRVRQPSQSLERENRSVIAFITNESRALGRLRLRLNGRGDWASTGFEMLLLHDRIPQAADIRALAEQHRAAIRTNTLAVDDPGRLQADMVPGARGAAGYAGSAACRDCHPTAARHWSESGHARAFATLVRVGADMDPECVQCHTVGFGTPTGYRREFKGSRLAEVGCESCHGPGARHVEERRSGGAVDFKFRPLGAGDCQKCHHGEFSRPFDWDKFWPHVRHGREGAG